MVANIICCFLSGMPKDDTTLVYAWEFSDPKSGQILPIAGYVAETASTESQGKLRLTGLLENNIPSNGRCVVSYKAEPAIRYYSDYFVVGKKCEPSGFHEW